MFRSSTFNILAICCMTFAYFGEIDINVNLVNKSLLFINL